MARCPMCQTRVGRQDIICAACGFALPSSGAPILGPPPASVADSRLFDGAASGMRSPSSARLEVPLPVRRDLSELLSLVFPAIWIFASIDSGLPIIFLAGLLFAAGGVPPAVYSLLGKEKVLVYSDRLVVERTILGVRVRRLSVEVRDLTSIESVGGKKGDSSGKKSRAAFWTFTKGPVRIVTTRGDYEFAEGLADEPAIAKELVGRLKRELPLPQRT